MQLKSLHSQLNLLCAATVANNGQGEEDSTSAADQLAKAQEIIRQRWADET